MSQTIAEAEVAQESDPFRGLEVLLDDGFRRRDFAAEWKNGDPADGVTGRLIGLIASYLAEAWGGRDSACDDQPELCPGIEELSSYAAWFMVEFAALGASLEEAGKLTLDLHDALDREHHTAEDPAFLAELHFGAVYPERVAERNMAADACDDERFAEDDNDLLLHYLRDCFFASTLKLARDAELTHEERTELLGIPCSPEELLELERSLDAHIGGLTDPQANGIRTTVRLFSDASAPDGITEEQRLAVAILLSSLIYPFVGLDAEEQSQTIQVVAEAFAEGITRRKVAS